MDEVLLDREAPVAAEVAADGARGGDGRVGGAGERAEALDQRWPSITTASTGPDSMNSTQRLVERLALVLGVVLGEQFRGRRAQLDGRRACSPWPRPGAGPRRAGRGATPSGLTRTRVRCDVGHAGSLASAVSPARARYAAQAAARSRSILRPSKYAAVQSAAKTSPRHEHHGDDEAQSRWRRPARGSPRRRPTRPAACRPAAGTRPRARGRRPPRCRPGRRRW